MQSEKKSPPSQFSVILKNLFFLLIILQFAPTVIMSIKKTLIEAITPKTHVGIIKLTSFMGNSELYIKQLHTFLKRPDIKAVLLTINSQGGLPGTSQAIFNELKKFKEKKPIVALVEDLCVSGSYYAACASNHIIANPSSIIGSIGVILGMAGIPLPNFKELTDDWKIKFELIQSGKFKSAGNPFKKNSQEEIGHLQNISDDTYQQFINDIAQTRNLLTKDHHIWADGKIFTGNQALKLKLIDQIGSMQDALDKLKELTKSTAEIKLISAQKPPGFMGLFAEEQGYGTESLSLSDFIAQTIHSIWNKFVLKQANQTQTLL